MERPTLVSFMYTVLVVGLNKFYLNIRMETPYCSRGQIIFNYIPILLFLFRDYRNVPSEYESQNSYMSPEVLTDIRSEGICRRTLIEGLLKIVNDSTDDLRNRWKNP